MTRRRSILALVLLAVLTAPASPGLDPLAGLPPYMRVVLAWGQRPEWDRDSRHLVFMEKAFGDAYRLDLATGTVTPLTTHFFHDGFDRVLPLANGDYLLTGTRDFEAKDPWKTRHRLEMFVLDKSLAKPAVPLGEWCDEGPAVSRTRLHLAWTAPGQRDMYEADLVYAADGAPSLSGRRLVLSYADRPQTERLETQDFRPPDEKELLFSCYSGTVEEPFYFSDVCGLDLATGRVRNYTSTPEQYDEVEGVFPDGQHTMVESDRHGVNRKWKIDVYRLALDGTNHADRITFFDAIGGPYHGSNPVVSPDGRFAAVQLGIHGMGAGQGRGLVVVDLAAWEKTLAR
ncbi:MAG: hypothetical protein U0599_05080 [Vicinamibacteria bacterium]